MVGTCPGSSETCPKPNCNDASFRNVAELLRTIEHYISGHNRNPVIWTAKAADISDLTRRRGWHYVILRNRIAQKSSLIYGPIAF
jgi:hypothetical protein